MKRTKKFLQVANTNICTTWINLSEVEEIEISARSGIWIKIKGRKNFLRILPSEDSYNETLSHLLELGIIPPNTKHLA